MPRARDNLLDVYAKLVKHGPYKGGDVTPEAVLLGWATALSDGAADGIITEDAAKWLTMRAAEAQAEIEDQLQAHNTPS